MHWFHKYERKPKREILPVFLTQVRPVVNVISGGIQIAETGRIDNSYHRLELAIIENHMSRLPRCIEIHPNILRLSNSRKLDYNAGIRVTTCESQFYQLRDTLRKR